MHEKVLDFAELLRNLHSLSGTSSYDAGAVSSVIENWEQFSSINGCREMNREREKNP